MKLRDKIIFLVVFFISLIWAIYLTKSALEPFFFSLIIAYFLDPAVDFLQRKCHLSRSSSTALILGIFLAIIISLSIIFLPIIFAQLSDFIGVVPKYFQTITTDIYPKFATMLNKFGFGLNPNFAEFIGNSQLAAQSGELWKNIFTNAIDSSKAILSIASLIFIAPILIFYLLRDWNLLVKKIDTYLPKQSSQTVRQIAKDIDKTLSGYVRGQFNVCFILALIYSILLSFTGLNFGFLIGFLTGLFAFIPFIGMLCGITAATIVGLFQWGFDLQHALAITAVFCFGQIIESNFLTPRLIGSKIGLHPVWVIFGLFFFGALFGFIGVLIAVPSTAICGVIIKHFALQYKKKFT